MAGGLVRNTLVNLTAHGVNALVALLLAPILVIAYGIDKYGLIVLARNLLPGGFVSLFDFGLPEAVTRYTSSAVAGGQTEKAQHLVVSALAIAGLAAIVLAALIVASGHYLIELVFRVPGELAGSFRLALWASAAALLLQFPGWILKAALEGLERFDVVRTAEIAGAVAYAAAAAAIALAGIDYHWVIIAFVLASSARFLYLAFYLVLRKPAGLDLRRGRWRPAELGPALRHAFAFFQGKILSVAFNFAPSMVISALAGPAATGIYDLMMRIPRMVKVLSGMLGTALLPFAARSEIRSQAAHVERVVYSGTMLAAVLVFPVATAVAVLSRDVLAAWLGQDFVHFAPWLALAMSWPARWRACWSRRRCRSGCWSATTGSVWRAISRRSPRCWSPVPCCSWWSTRSASTRRATTWPGWADALPRGALRTGRCSISSRCRPPSGGRSTTSRCAWRACSACGAWSADERDDVAKNSCKKFGRVPRSRLSQTRNEQMPPRSGRPARCQ